MRVCFSIVTVLVVANLPGALLRQTYLFHQSNFNGPKVSSMSSALNRKILNTLLPHSARAVARRFPGQRKAAGLWWFLQDRLMMNQILNPFKIYFVPLRRNGMFRQGSYLRMMDYLNAKSSFTYFLVPAMAFLFLPVKKSVYHLIWYTDCGVLFELVQ